MYYSTTTMVLELQIGSGHEWYCRRGHLHPRPLPSKISLKKDNENLKLTHNQAFLFQYLSVQGSFFLQFSDTCSGAKHTRSHRACNKGRKKVLTTDSRHRELLARAQQRRCFQFDLTRLRLRILRTNTLDKTEINLKELFISNTHCTDSFPFSTEQHDID